MQRLGAEVGPAVGSVYTYFPAKGALVAEVQREAIERLATSAAVLGSDVAESVPPEEAGRVVPAAMRLLGLAEARLDLASTHGALDDADAADRRTIALAAALTGCVQLRVVQRWDDDLVDPIGTGRHVLDALLLGWGAAPVALADAHRLVDGLEAVAPLARPIPERTD